MEINQQLMFLAIMIVTTTFFVYMRSFKDDIPTCDGYITNVYLYVILGLLMTAFFVLFIAKRNYAITGTKSMLAFVVAMTALFTLFSIEPQQALLNHLVWVVFIIAMSVSVYSVWRYTDYRGTLTSTLVITLLIVAGMTIIAHVKPEWINLGWGSGLTLALLAGILAWVVPMFLGDIGNMSNYYKMLSGLFVFLFSILILYDTKLLRVKATRCIIPDYPTDSLGLFLDVINMFNNIGIMS